MYIIHNLLTNVISTGGIDTESYIDEIDLDSDETGVDHKEVSNEHIEKASNNHADQELNGCVELTLNDHEIQNSFGSQEFDLISKDCDSISESGDSATRECDSATDEYESASEVSNSNFTESNLVSNKCKCCTDSTTAAASNLKQLQLDRVKRIDEVVVCGSVIFVFICLIAFFVFILI